MQPIKTRRTRSAGLKLGAVASLAVALVLAGSARDDASASVPAAKRISNGTISVGAVSTAAEAERLTNTFHREGIDLSIDAVPAGPQFVGTWVYSSYSASVPKALVKSVVEQTQGYTATIDLPSSFRGAIRLAVGRAPAQGEEIQVDGLRNALAPGALLGCLQGTGADPGRVKAAAQNLGYTVTWADGDKSRSGEVGSPAPGERVVTAYIADATPDRVQFVVATPGTVQYDAQSRRGYSPAQWQAHTEGISGQKGCHS
jgi:hypothetical protein